MNTRTDSYIKEEGTITMTKDLIDELEKVKTALKIRGSDISEQKVAKIIATIAQAQDALRKPSA